MKKRSMRLLSLILIAFLSLGLTGCYNGYKGDYPELFTQATNSLLWNFGLSFLTDYVTDPYIEKIEEDNYGRVLFEYKESFFERAGKNSDGLAFSALMIMQKADDAFVYYYEDFSFICKEKETNVSAEVQFDLREINDLKAQNDWGQKLDLGKCIRQEITNQKQDLPFGDLIESIIDELYEIDEEYWVNTTYFLTQDDYGRFICYSKLRFDNNRFRYIVFIFNPDMSYVYFEPETFYNYQQELKEFKEQNGWNEPIGQL